MKKLFFLSSVLSSLVLISCGEKKPHSITLALKLEKGQQFQTETTAKQQIQSSMMGQTTNIDQTFLTTYQIDVEEINASGNYIIRTTYKRIRLEQNIEGWGDLGNTVVDTEKPDDNQGFAAEMTAPLMQGLIGKSFTSEVDKKGNTLKIDMSEIIETGATKEGDNSPSKYSINFPEKPVKVGDSWEEEKEIKTKNTAMKIKSKHTLKSISDEIAEIESTGTIEPLNAGDNIKGTQTAITKVNLKNGWSIESKIIQDMEVDVVQNEQIVSTKIKSEVTVISK